MSNNTLDNALAAVLGCSATSGNINSPAKMQAKEALGIAVHKKALTDDEETAIVEWHKAQLHRIRDELGCDDAKAQKQHRKAIAQWYEAYKTRSAATDDRQSDIESIAPAVVLRGEPAENEDGDNITCHPVESPAEVVNDILSPADNVAIDDAMALINSNPVIDAKDARIAELEAKLAAIDAKNAPTYSFNELVRLTVKTENKAVQIAISGFYLNALMVATGIDKKRCKAWVQSAIDNWTPFDAKSNVTKQVELLIVRELESQLIKARGNAKTHLINPVLPANFWNNPIENRSEAELAQWYEKPFIVTNENGCVVYCLNGGAWDRPTMLGAFDTVEAALKAIG